MFFRESISKLLSKIDLAKQLTVPISYTEFTGKSKIVLIILEEIFSFTFNILVPKISMKWSEKCKF